MPASINKFDGHDVPNELEEVILTELTKMTSNRKLYELYPMLKEQVKLDTYTEHWQTPLSRMLYHKSNLVVDIKII